LVRYCINGMNVLNCVHNHKGGANIAKLSIRGGVAMLHYVI